MKKYLVLALLTCFSLFGMEDNKSLVNFDDVLNHNNWNLRVALLDTSEQTQLRKHIANQIADGQKPLTTSSMNNLLLGALSHAECYKVNMHTTPTLLAQTVGRHNKESFALQCSKELSSAYFNPVGDQIAVCNYNRADIINPSTGKTISTINHPMQKYDYQNIIETAAYNKQGNLLATEEYYGLYIWDLQSNTDIIADRKYRHSTYGRPYWKENDHELLLSDANNIYIVDLRSPQEISLMKGDFENPKFNRAEDKILTEETIKSGYPDKIYNRLIDARVGKILQTYNDHHEAPHKNNLLFCNNDTSIALLDSRNRCLLFDTETGAPHDVSFSEAQQEYYTPGNKPMSIRGNVIALTNKGKIWFIDSTSLLPRGSIEPIDDKSHITSLDFNAKGNQIVATYSDNAVRIWDVNL